MRCLPFRACAEAMTQYANGVYVFCAAGRSGRRSWAGSSASAGETAWQIYVGLDDEFR